MSETFCHNSFFPMHFMNSINYNVTFILLNEEKELLKLNLNLPTQHYECVGVYKTVFAFAFSFPDSCSRVYTLTVCTPTVTPHHTHTHTEKEREREGERKQHEAKKTQNIDWSKTAKSSNGAC